MCSSDLFPSHDTRAQQATIDNLIAQTSNEKIKRGLILGQIRVADAEEELKRNTADWTKEKTEETRWNIKSLQKGIDKLAEEIDGMKLDNDLKRRTIDNKVKESALTLQNLMAEILLKGSQRKVNEKLTKEIDGVELDNDLKKRTIDNKVKESALTLQNHIS